MVGIGPFDIDVNSAGYQQPECHLLYCMNGKLYQSGFDYLERDIRESSTVGVLVDATNGGLYFFIDGVMQARALSVSAETKYHLVVMMLVLFVPLALEPRVSFFGV